MLEEELFRAPAAVRKLLLNLEHPARAFVYDGPVLVQSDGGGSSQAIQLHDLLLFQGRLAAFTSGCSVT